MAAYTSALFVGSVVLSASTIEVNGTPVAFPAGTYYLTDPLAARSLVATFAAAVATQAPGAVAFLTPSGKVRITAAGVFTITWGSVALRQALGFGILIAGSAAYTAVDKSPLYFSPGKPASFGLSPIGVVGSKRHIVNQSVSAYGQRAQSSNHGYVTRQRFSFEKIAFERVQTTDGLNGEYDVWFTQVAVRSARFKVYHDAQEDPSDTTTEFTHESAPLGPYIVPLAGGADFDYKRSSGFQWTDYTVDLEINAYGTPEVA